MIHTYTVTGMTCNGCKASVEKHLNALPNITQATVDLEAQEVTVKLSQYISIKSHQEALPEKFLISENKQEETLKELQRFKFGQKIYDSIIQQLRQLEQIK